MPAIKNVTATAAAEAMGKFCRPHLCENGRYAAGLSAEYLGYKPTPSDRRSARKTAAAIEEARRIGLLVWVAGHSFGTREIEADESVVVSVPDWGSQNCYWNGFRPKGVRKLTYVSSVSGACLHYVRTSEEGGTLEYIPPANNPGYKGQYYGAWLYADGEVIEYDLPHAVSHVPSQAPQEP